MNMHGHGAADDRARALKEVYPLGVYRDAAGAPRTCARVGEHALDLGAGNLDEFLAAGPAAWQELYDELPGRAAGGADLIPLTELSLLMPFTVADYVDFYTSEHHATNLGRILRPGQEPLFPNWRHQPIGYHGRAGTVVVSGTDVVRPTGNTNVDGVVSRRPTARLDIEVEVGFVVGVPSGLGQPIPIESAVDHIFGVVLLNDWSARDIQAWETVPLGPFLGKSFQTSISPWVVPLRALEAARIAPRPTGIKPAEWLQEDQPWGLDLELELRVNGALVSRPPYREMSWSPTQLLAYLTSNGAAARTGDLLASGTVSGARSDQVGSLIEAWGAERFLADGDVVVITATAPSGDGDRIDLGEVRGRVLPAPA
jgi:fumarylacetoacetase